MIVFLTSSGYSLIVFFSIGNVSDSTPRRFDYLYMIPQASDTRGRILAYATHFISATTPVFSMPSSGYFIH